MKICGFFSYFLLIETTSKTDIVKVDKVMSKSIFLDIWRKPWFFLIKLVYPTFFIYIS